MPPANSTGFLAIDIGGSSIKAAYVTGDVLAHKARYPETPSTIAALENMVFTIIRDYQAKGLVINGVGISSFGSISTAGVILRGDRVDGYDNYVWVGSIKKEFGIDAVSVSNDGLCAVWGVHACDPVAKGHTSVAHFVVGTGVGGGAVLNNRLWRGATGLAGHFGHTKMVTAHPRDCACSFKGCIETVASASALQADAMALTGRALTMQEIVDACATDAAMRGVVERAGAALGVGIGNIINTLDPGLITLGGGVVDAFGPPETNIYVAAAKRSAQQNTIIRAFENTRIEVTSLGNDAALYGAAALVAAR